MKVAIIGTTAWGTTLGVMLARRGMDVALWARTEEAEVLGRARENAVRLPGIRVLFEGLDPARAMADLLGVQGV